MKCNNITSYFYQVVNLYFFMGTVCACGDGCALLVPFHGHSTGLRRWLCPLVPFHGHIMSLRRWLCPPCSISWAQRELAAVAVPSWFHFMGTAQTCGGGCALVRLRQTQTSHIHKKKCPDHIFPDPGTVHYQIINSLSLQRWHYRYTTGNICPSER